MLSKHDYRTVASPSYLRILIHIPNQIGTKLKIQIRDHLRHDLVRAGQCPLVKLTRMLVP